MDESAGKDLEVKRSGAGIDDALSQCDDLMAISSSSTLTVDRSSEPGNKIDFEQAGTVETEADQAASEDIEEMPELIEMPKFEKSRKNVKVNLRKSLAWDSAFFTSDGVLDADELSTMIEGGDKGKHHLPGIEEEVYKSMDSISTLESDNLSLDCLEAELFEDIRASIQKSSKSSNLNNSSIKVSSGKKDSQPKTNSSLKKVDLDSGKWLGTRTKDNTSSIPQPKIVNRLNMNRNFTTASTKRASLSANHAKKDQDIAKKANVAQKGTQTEKPTVVQGSKVTGIIGPRRVVPKPSSSSKLSSSGSSTTLKTDPARPSSSSSSCSSGTGVKVNIPRKKVDTKSAKLTAGSIIPKAPSRISMDNKHPPVSSNVSSSISPASSVSDWCSESRGSSVHTSVSCRSFDGDTSIQSALSIHPTPQISNGNQTSSLSGPPSVQPTGLRMPSPKIGFFDRGKAGVRTPTGAAGIRSQSRLPNSQTSSNSVKTGKLPPPKTTVTHTNMKPNPHKISPKPSQEQPTFKPKTKTSLVTSDVSDHNNESSSNLCITSSHDVHKDSDKRSNSGNNASEVSYNKCFDVTTDDNKPLTDGSRTPFAIKNSVSDANGTAMEVTEKTVNFPFLESQQNENSEVV